MAGCTTLSLRTFIQSSRMTSRWMTSAPHLIQLRWSYWALPEHYKCAQRWRYSESKTDGDMVPLHIYGTLALSQSRLTSGPDFRNGAGRCETKCASFYCSIGQFSVGIWAAMIGIATPTGSRTRSIPRRTQFPGHVRGTWCWNLDRDVHFNLR